MSLKRKFLGPKSKYDKSLPYTYMAKAQIMKVIQIWFQHILQILFVDLLNIWMQRKITPNEAELFGIYRKDEIKLDKKILIDNKGNWLLRPEICNVTRRLFRKD